MKALSPTNPNIRVKQALQTGYYMVTELISVLVFGLIMASLASDSTSTLINVGQSLQRTHANFMLQEIITLMQVNRSEVIDGNFTASNQNIICKNGIDGLSSTKLAIAKVFCSSIDTNDDIDQYKSSDKVNITSWGIECLKDAADISPTCPENSELNIYINWKIASNEAGKEEISGLSFKTRL